MIFLFFGERGEKGKDFRVANVNWGFEGRWENKSGIRRFYRRVWKNIFYEWRDKEKRDGVFGGEGEVIFFLKFFEWGGGEFEILWGNVCLGYGVGEGKRRGKG